MRKPIGTKEKWRSERWPLSPRWSSSTSLDRCIWGCQSGNIIPQGRQQTNWVTKTISSSGNPSFSSLCVLPLIRKFTSNAFSAGQVHHLYLIYLSWCKYFCTFTVELERPRYPKVHARIKPSNGVRVIRGFGPLIRFQHFLFLFVNCFPDAFLTIMKARASSVNQQMAVGSVRISWNINSYKADAILIHHKMFHSLTEEQGVQKNMKIQYLKGGTKVYLKSGTLFKHCAFHFIVCPYLPPLTDPSLACVLMREGICCDPIDWLTPEFPFLPQRGICMFISHREKAGSVQRICHLPPWPPGATVISIQVNITGSGFPIMFHSHTLCCSRTQTWLTCKRSNNFLEFKCEILCNSYREQKCDSAALFLTKAQRGTSTPLPPRPDPGDTHHKYSFLLFTTSKRSVGKGLL